MKRSANIVFICAHLNETNKIQFNKIKKSLAVDLNIIDYVGCTRDVIASCDAALIASGTATLETMLHKKPMVVAYKVSNFLGYILKKMMKTEFIALPNILAGKGIVSEFKQKEAHKGNISQALLKCLNNDEYKMEIKNEFFEIHKKLRLETNIEIVKNISEILD